MDISSWLKNVSLVSYLRDLVIISLSITSRSDASWKLTDQYKSMVNKGLWPFLNFALQISHQRGEIRVFWLKIRILREKLALKNIFWLFVSQKKFWLFFMVIKKSALAGTRTRVPDEVNANWSQFDHECFYIWDNIFCVTKIRFLGWLSWDLPWLYRDPAWLYRDLGWLCRDLAWFCRGLAWLYRDLAWLYRKLACALGLDFPQDTTRRDHHLDVVSEWLRR